MNSVTPRNNVREAFTLIELLVVIAIIAILAALLLPVLTQGQQKGRQIVCVNNLKETGIAFLAFAHDHHDRFPMDVPMAEGGSKEFVQGGYRVAGEFFFSYRHFQPISNEIVTAKILYCPADVARQPATNFAGFKNENLSSFIGVTADPAKPTSILAGDRNVTNDFNKTPSIVRTSLGNPIRWTADLHKYKGNLLFADGHVAETKDVPIAENVTALSGDLFLPSVQPPTYMAGSPTAPMSAAAASQNPTPMRPPPVVMAASGGNGSIAPVVAELSPAPVVEGPPLVTVPSPPRPPTAVKPKVPAATNPPPVVSPAAVVTPVATGSKTPWLIFLILLILLMAAVAMRLRQRARRYRLKGSQTEEEYPDHELDAKS